MSNDKPYNYNQTSIVVINYEEQLLPDTFEFALHNLFSNTVDLSSFHLKYKNEKLM